MDHIATNTKYPQPVANPFFQNRAASAYVGCGNSKLGQFMSEAEAFKILRQKVEQVKVNNTKDSLTPLTELPPITHPTFDTPISCLINNASEILTQDTA